MKVELEKPLDNPESVFKSGVQVNINGGSWINGFLKSHENEWQRKLQSAAVFYNSKKESDVILKRIVTQGTDVFVGTKFGMSDWMAEHRELSRGQSVHFAKEGVKMYNPAGWAVQKASPWLEALNKHILILEQAIRNNITQTLLNKENIDFTQSKTTFF